MATRRLNDFTVDGNVGIGTTSPTEKLDVDGKIRASGNIEVYGGGRMLVNTSASSLRFGTSNTERMRIDSSGDVGIGTASPTEKLDVDGNVQSETIILNGGSSNPAVFMERGDGTDVKVLQLNPSTDNVTIGHTDIDELIFHDDSGEAMRLDGSGNLGIGTTSPAVSLDVNSTDAIGFPTGTTAQRPSSPAAGMLRYNSTEGQFEGYTTEWGSIGGGDDFSLKSITKNASNQFPITFADSTNFKLSASGTWTITATIASDDVGKSGIILIVNTAATTPGALPSTFKTPNGDNIVFETDSGDYSVISYFIASTTHVLVNYVGNFS